MLFFNSLFRFAYWLSNNLGNNPGNDIWNTQVKSGLETGWIDLENTSSSLNEWSEKRFVLSNYTNIGKS